MKKTDSKKEVMKVVYTMKEDAEYVNQKIREAKAMFKAVQYSIVENILDDDEKDNCMLGFSFLMESLLDLSENCYSNSTNPCAEVESLLSSICESEVEK